MLWLGEAPADVWFHGFHLVTSVPSSYVPHIYWSPASAARLWMTAVAMQGGGSDSMCVDLVGTQGQSYIGGALSKSPQLVGDRRSKQASVRFNQDRLSTKSLLHMLIMLLESACELR